MPWKECSVMDERLQFVVRRLAGEPMAELCREFGISRKTGYKIFDRYQECGIQGLTDRSRRPYRYAHQLPFQVENFILNVKREHSSWGARKIRERLIRRFSGIKIPAKSTIHAVLDRHGLVERRGRVRRRAQGTPLSLGQRPNELWCTDYKGEFQLGNHQYCYPLTVTDHASRFLLTCEALCSTKEVYAFTVFERLFTFFHVCSCWFLLVEVRSLSHKNNKSFFELAIVLALLNHACKSNENRGWGILASPGRRTVEF
jgi:transposase